MRGSEFSQEKSQNKTVIVKGPVGFNPANALFAEGVHVDEDDILIAIERPGNVSVEILPD